MIEEWIVTCSQDFVLEMFILYSKQPNCIRYRMQIYYFLGYKLNYSNSFN